LGRKVSDEFTVPLCRAHHRDNHRFGDERAWWSKVSIDPIQISQKLWTISHQGTDQHSIVTQPSFEEHPKTLVVIEDLAARKPP
jgi:hypothetical protein